MQGAATQGGVQVITGQQPFPGAKDGVIIYSVVTGERPSRPSGSNERLPDNVWNLISRCWSPSWDGRPDVNLVMNVLDNAADDPGVASRNVSGASHGYQS